MARPPLVTGVFFATVFLLCLLALLTRKRRRPLGPRWPSTIFCFLVRDGKAYLEDNVRAIVHFAEEHCQSWKICYVENDSSDGTRDILDALEWEYAPDMRGERLDDVSGLHTHDICAARQEPDNCQERILLLAKLRQRLVEAALEAKTEVLVMADLDFVSFDAEALARLYPAAVALEADGAFGMSVHANGAELYDHGAVRPQSVLPAMDDVSADPVPVQSAFSGFGVYMTSALRRNGASYKDATGLEMEHVSFNSSLKGLFVDRRFRPRY